MLFTSTLSWPLAFLVYLCKLLCLKYVLPTNGSLSAQKSTIFFILFSPGYIKSTSNILTHPLLHPIHSDLLPHTINLYPLPTLSKTLSRSFQSVSLSSPSPSEGLYPTTTTHILTLENLNLTHRIPEQAYPKSIAVLCHTMF